MFGLTDAAHIGISAALTSMTTAALGSFVLLKDPKSSLYRVFSAYSFSITVWSTLLAFHVFAENRSVAEYTARYLHVGATLIPTLFVHFVLQFFYSRKRKTINLLVAPLYVITATLMFLCINGTLVSEVAPKYGIKYLMVANPGYIYLVLYFIACAAWGLSTLLVGYLKAEGVRKNQIKYLLFGSLLGYFGGLDNFLYLYDVTIFPLFPYGSYAIPIYVSSTAYAIAQYRLLDISVAIRKSIIYASLLFMLLVPCYILVIWGQQVAFGSINYTFSMATLLLFIIVGFLFPKIRFRTEEALERALFQKRVNYRETLLYSSKDMVSIVDLESLSNNLVRTIGRALGIEKASLFLLEEAKGVFSLKASIGVAIDPQLFLLRDDPLLVMLTKAQNGIVREELEMDSENLNWRRTSRRMEEIEAEISIPIMSKEKLIGALNLGYKPGKEIYSNEDLELLSTLANQAAVAIENARLYQNLKQSQDTLRRADRLSSLGLLTAGLAHEIRNPLVAIRTFTQLLPERYEDAEFRNGFQSLALKEVDRICGLITDLLSFARPSKPNVAQEDMNNVIEGIARILDTQAKEKSVELVRHFAPNLPKVWIDREQMKQVFMNLIFNGIQAMNDGGTITISTRIFTSDAIEQAPSFVQVEVRDTGVGIPNENLEHIFDPFFTSKDEGSGLGLSISHQIVQEHGGYVTVESKVGKGTSFLVNIPIGKPVRAMTERNLHVHEANLSH
ncbi:MAG TPA: ATP-binding protein [Candidatus Binatia bacterium]